MNPMRYSLHPSPLPPQIQLSPSHHVVQLVEGAVRTPVAPNPVQPATEMMTLDLLDFDPDVACDAMDPDCDDEAVSYWRIPCGCRGIIAYCLGHDHRVRELNARGGGWCHICGTDMQIIRCLGPVRSGGTS